MHERSETIQNKNGKWVNVYGKGLLKQGKVLPILYPWFEQEEYDTEKQAVAAAKQRSDLYKEDEPEKPWDQASFHGVFVCIFVFPGQS